jgi:predicted amidohydrolase YtcJ
MRGFMRRAVLAFAAIALIGAKDQVQTAAPGGEPATIYSGGPIITMAESAPQTVEAIAVKEGKIIAVGKLAKVTYQAGKAARRIDLKGRTLLPGFIDAHGHVSYVGQAEGMVKLAPPPVGGVDSIAKLQDALRTFLALAKLPLGAPLVGNGYDDSQLAEKRHPTRQDLDAVATDRPIIVLHASGHLASANSFALAKYGITADRPDPQGGVFRREADGKTPNGVMEETALFVAMGAIMPKGLDPAIASLVTAQKLYASNGITTAQDGRVMPEQWPALEEAARRGALMLDTVALTSFEREWPETVRARIGKGYVGRLRIAGVKLTVDGSPQGRTAWLHDPVPVPPPGKDKDYRGYPAIDLKLFNARLGEAAKNGWQVFVHVNGDEAAQALIDGVRANGLAGKRTIAIHNQVVRPEQLRAMKALDIQPSFFVSHTYYWGDWHRDVALGPKRAAFISPQASAWAIGLRPTAHNDSPVVPPDIMRLVWSSVNRITLSGQVLGPAERIPVYRALQQVTINAAWQIGEDTSKGSLAVGKRADLVLLDADPLKVDPAKLFAIKVVATIKDGKTVFGQIE